MAGQSVKLVAAPFPRISSQASQPASQPLEPLAANERGHELSVRVSYPWQEAQE